MSKSMKRKARIVDLGRGDSFGFLGFDFRRTRSRRGVWRAQYTPKLKKRTALLRKLKETFRRFQSQPLDRVVELVNPVLRGWVGYLRSDTRAGAWLHQRLGGKEGAAPFGASQETTGLRLEQVE